VFDQVEADSFCAQIIQKRMAEGFLPPGQVHENVVTFNPSPKVRESVTGIVGGFPCQEPQIPI